MDSKMLVNQASSTHFVVSNSRIKLELSVFTFLCIPSHKPLVILHRHL
jgi:hypothetical protein